jgi:hypothetical protein
MIFASVALGGCQRIATARGEYRGIALRGTTFLCKSDDVAAAGFWRDIDSKRVTRDASVTKQSNTTTWRIKLLGQTAEVIAYTGATQTVEAPERFTVEQATGGLMLVSADRGAGESPQVITIDPTNGSFVYSSQHVSPLYNRANVFHGICIPYS